jgi:hypothetical protein
MHPAALAGADPRAAILAQLMHPGAGGPPGMPPGAGPAGPPDQPDAADKANISPLHAVQSVIEDLHDLMRLLPDPGAVNVAAQCLKAMTGLQQTMMKPGGGNGAG